MFFIQSVLCQNGTLKTTILSNVSNSTLALSTSLTTGQSTSLTLTTSAAPLTTSSVTPLTTTSFTELPTLPTRTRHRHSLTVQSDYITLSATVSSASSPSQTNSFVLNTGTPDYAPFYSIVDEREKPTLAIFTYERNSARSVAPWFVF